MGKVLQRALVLSLVFSLLLSLVPGPSAAAGPDWRKIDPALKDMMIRDARGDWPIIVEAEARVLPEADQRGQAERAGRAAQRLRAHAGRERFSLPIIGAVGGVAGYDTITALSNDPAVAFIYYDAPLRALETPTPVHIYEDVVKAPAAWDAGYTGRGVGIAVLDSGVLPTADLTVPRNRVVSRVDLVGDGAGSLDPGGHGTHVAGIIAGNGYDSRDNAAGAFRGIAPEAQIVDVRVIDGKGASNLSTVIRGIQWVLQNKRAYNIRIINLSLGRPVGDGYTYRSDPLVAALEIAWFAGIVVVVPAGNGGPDGGTINSPGTGPLFLTVGALDDAGTVEAGDDVVPSFSGRGPTPDGIAKPDFVAPGRRIISLRSPGSYLDQAHPERVVATSTGSTYFRLTGTSMAAPVVSGVAALLLEKNPRLLPDQVKEVLARTATRLPAQDANAVGAGLVDAQAALNAKAAARANQVARPADAAARALLPFAKGKALGWRNGNGAGRFWQDLAWDNIYWDNIYWDNIYWDGTTWDNVLWDNIYWDNVYWDAWPGSDLD